MNHKIHIWLTTILLLSANNIISATIEENAVPEPFSVQTIDKTDLAKYAVTTKATTSSSATGLFANGYPTTIEEGTDSKNIKVTTTYNGNEVTYELPGSSTVVFGGKYNDDCDATNITLKSGTVYSIVGGGYGTSSENSADVTTSTINLNGGTVNNWVVGGGAYYSKTTTANINAKGEAAPTVNGWMIGCIESGSITTGTAYPEFDNTPCKLETMNLDIQKGTYWLIALAGGNGTRSFTKTGNATIKGTSDAPVSINGGLFGCGSNGRGESATGSIEYCTLSANELEIASVNRGMLENVDFTFKNCTFSNNIYAYLGSTYKWADGYSTSTVGVPQKVKFTIESTCTGVPSFGISEGLDKASVELTGAKGKIAPYNNGNNNNIVKSFTIGSDKTWTFNDGLEMTNDVTLTKTGTLKVAGTYTVSTAAQLEDAIQQEAVTEILLNNGDYELTKLLEINRPITLSSANTDSKAKIKGHISITAEGVTVKDIDLEYTKGENVLYSDKNGISVFANEATITGNSFKTTDNTVTNGIVFYPKGKSAVAQKYTVTKNSFNLSNAGSTGIIVRENFKSNSQIPDAGTTATLSNGSELDKLIIASESNNTFSSMTGGYYVRVTGNYSVLDATGTGSDALTQKYIYSYVNADNVADAIVSSQMGATVNATSVASSALADKLNALTSKPALASGVTILCSNNKTVYTDLASALASTTSNAEYISYTAGDTPAYKVETAKKSDPTIADGDKPAASDIEVGQPLSASLLSGGVAKASEKNIPGVFSWAKPDTKVEKTTDEYDVIFTPTDQTLYNVVKDIKVSVKATQYYTVTIGNCENGKVEITKGGNSANKYKQNDKLTLKVTPDKHYAFDKWTEGAEEYTVTKDASLVATFKQITHKVTFGENITVLNTGEKVTSEDKVAEGSVLTVTAAQAGKELTALTCNGQKIINNQVVVSGEVKIEATFADIKPTTRLVQVDYNSDNTKNGKIKLYDKSGNILESGSAVTIGEDVNIEAIPDYGYQVKQSGLSVTNATLNGNKFTVSEGEGAITVKQEFEKKKFKVTLPTAETDHATVTLSNSSLDAVDFGTELTISSATPSTGYKLVAIVVNGKVVASGSKFTVTADTKVNAVTVALPIIQFVDTKQTYTYNGSEQAFVVRTVPAGITGITLTYKQNGQDATPTDAGEYKVYATYNGQDYVQPTEAIGTLTIKKAQYTAVTIPTQDSNIEDNKENASEGEYYKESEEGNFQKVAYKLSTELSKNYETPKFVIPQAGKTIDKVTFASAEKQATPLSSIITKAENKELTLTGEGGSIEVYNGPVKANDGFEGQTVTLKAIPDAGYSSRPTWSGTNVTDKGDGTATIQLGAGEVKATFKKKADIEAPIETGKTLSSTYNGATYGSETMDLSSVVKSATTGWSLTIKQGDLTVDQPTNAGSYDIVASRQEDEVYASTTKTIGTLNIAKATPVLSEVAASAISSMQSLNESVISGTSNVSGTFSWVNEQAQLKKGENSLAVKFTPDDDSNYEEKTTQVTLTVNALAGDVTVRTLSLVVNNPEMGSAVVMSLDNVVLEGNTATLGKDNKTLKVTFSSNSGYKSVATINKSSYTSGNDYSIPAEGNVEVVVTYSKKEENPGGGSEEPGTSETPVSGIKLDATSKTLAVGESFALKATVSPSDADNKKVNWSSNNPAIATVDKDGNVKALKVGKCTITATTDDGNFTADCEVTVSVATGIEELLAANRIYADYGQIVIEPTASPEVLITDMTGRIMYYDRITGKTQVAVSGGFYLVRLSENGKATTVKVIVK